MANEQIKESVLERVSAGTSRSRVGRSLHRAGTRVVHVRYCSTDSARSTHYKFNINPTTLIAHYELWICGSANSYFLIPMHVLKHVYEHPAAYPDRYHAGYRVVSVDLDNSLMLWGRGGRRTDLAPYKAVCIPETA